MARNYKLTQTGQGVQDDLNKIEGASIEGGTIHIGGNSITPLTEETDPTVPAWAKAAEKPSYTADEVGALPDDTTLADLPDDTGHRTVSDAEKDAWYAKSDFSGDYPDLTNKPDLSQFITRSVDDLVNYYLKSEVYTKDEVADLLAGIIGGIWVTVSVLPQPSAATYGLKIYLVPSQEPAAQNQKDEFITTRTGSEGNYSYAWEQIGTTAIDLSEYVTNEDLQSALEDYVSTEAFQQAMAGKQDTLVSGQNIKTINGDSILGSGNIEIQGGGGSDPDAVKYTQQSLTDAQKEQARDNIGAGTYDKPSGGIPSSDMASAVQTSLGKADTAYQKPSSGIPASDLASGVIPTVPTDVVKYTFQSLTDAQKSQARTNIGAGTYSKPATGIPESDLASAVQALLGAGVSDVSSSQDGSVVITLENGNTFTISLLHTHPDKQDLLVSGTNIKTINNESILGSGNLGISDPDAVKFTSQSLTDPQKAQARTNIGAGTYSKPSGGIPASDLASGVIPDAVSANPTVPSGTTPTALTGLKIGSNYYDIEAGGGTVTDVTVGGTSVVDANGVAVVPAIPTVPTISTDIDTDATSDVKTTSPKAVKTFVEGKGYGTYSKPSGGIPASDLASGVIPDVTGKADKVSSPTAGNFAGLDANGNLTDSGSKASDFATAAQGALAASAYQKPASGIPVTDLAADVVPVIPTDTTIPSGGLDANVHYALGTLTGAVSITLDTTSEVSGQMNIYSLTFTAGSTAPTITWSSAITQWAGNCLDSNGAPVITAGNSYEVSILDGLAVITEFVA